VQGTLATPLASAEEQSLKFLNKEQICAIKAVNLTAASAA